MTLREIWQDTRSRVYAFYIFIRECVQEYSSDKALRYAASLAYYSIFSLAPVLLIAIALAGFFFGEAAVEGEIVALLEDVVGRESAVFIEDMLRRIRQQERGGLATIVSAVTILIGALAVFGALQDALNHIWRVRHNPDAGGISNFLKRRALAFLMVLMFGLLLIASLIASSLLAALSAYAAELSITTPWWLWRGTDLLVRLGFFTLVFAAIYKFLPDVYNRWRDVWMGALMTSSLFAAGNFIIGQYLARSSPGSIFGAAGTLVVLLVWIYYSWAIILFGAEMTQVFARRFGEGVRPTEDALIEPRHVADDAIERYYQNTRPADT